MSLNNDYFQSTLKLEDDNKSEFTETADLAFDDFCKKYFNTKRGIFSSLKRRGPYSNPNNPPHMKDIFNTNEQKLNKNVNNEYSTYGNYTTYPIEYTDIKYTNEKNVPKVNTEYSYNNGNLSNGNSNTKNYETPTSYNHQTNGIHESDMTNNHNSTFTNSNNIYDLNNYGNGYIEYNYTTKETPVENSTLNIYANGNINYYKQDEIINYHNIVDSNQNYYTNIYENSINYNVYDQYNVQTKYEETNIYQIKLEDTKNDTLSQKQNNKNFNNNDFLSNFQKKIEKTSTHNHNVYHDHQSENGNSNSVNVNDKDVKFSSSKFKREFLNKRTYSSEQEVISIKKEHTEVSSFAINNVNDGKISNIGLKVIACGLQKDGALPIPKSNFFIDKGNFGDDAGFWSEIDGHAAIGLADGATGNIMLGYDPGDFPRNLMQLCSDLFVEHDHLRSPKDLLMKAFDILQDKTCYGSCTACVLTLDYQKNQLKIANIGDSGYRLLRNGRIIKKSEPQRISSDCPRQIDSYPWKAESRMMGVSYTEIMGADCVCDDVQVLKNDVIILSSDGLYDNIEDNEIEDIFNKSKSVHDAAEKLVMQAVKHYKKPDDVLLIVGKLIENKPNSRHSIYSKEIVKKDVIDLSQNYSN